MNINVKTVVFLLLVFYSVAVIDVTAVEEVVGTTNTDVKSNDADEPRFMDFDGLLTSAMNSMNFKVDNYVNQGSSIVKKVTSQSHGGTLGGQTIVKTEITEISNNNPVGFRFKRDLFQDFMDQVEDKAELVKDKLANAVADSVNLAHSGMNKIKNRFTQGSTD